MYDHKGYFDQEDMKAWHEKDSSSGTSEADAG